MLVNQSRLQIPVNCQGFVFSKSGAQNILDDGFTYRVNYFENVKKIKEQNKDVILFVVEKNLDTE